MLPDGPGYVYVGGEASATRAARKHLRHERGLPPGAYGVLGYWRRDADTFRRTWQANQERFEKAYADAAVAAGATTSGCSTCTRRPWSATGCSERGVPRDTDASVGTRVGQA
ncbi:hypothetical protein WY02_20700 [Pseudonocardia sp. AL041005-10]|nr:hypothetical protein WY02_20700 [Pseudonocardia sp. AL041005-10]